MERIARDGREGFYMGPTAEALVETLRAGGNPMTLEDLASFEPRWRRPVCGTYRQYTVLGAPPPMAGIEVVQTLELLERHDLPSMGLPYRDPEALQHVVDAIRVAQADRSAWIGAPEEAAVPAAGMASEAYAEERVSLMGMPVEDSVPAGDPWEEDSLPPADRCAVLGPFPPSPFPRPEPEEMDEPGGGEGAEGDQTTHLSVVDAERNAVSLTYTLGLYFGSGTFSGGAFYNTAAYNFGGPPSNERVPGRPPRSSTAPSLVLEGDDVRLVVGSPASGRIPPAIVHTILYTLDHGLDPALAVAMPRIYPSSRSRTVRLEFGFRPEALAALRDRGYDLRVHGAFDMYFGGVHAVLVREDGALVGAADPRREGAAVGF